MNSQPREYREPLLRHEVKITSKPIMVKVLKAGTPKSSLKK